MVYKILIAMLLSVCIATVAAAHTPLCSCFDNGDETVTCEGGFSDGSSASGVEMRIETPKGEVLLKGKMSEDSEFTFDKPEGDYVVMFDAGEGHRIKVPGKEIVE